MFLNEQKHIIFETYLKYKASKVFTTILIGIKYDSDAEDFGTDAGQLDDWVFEKIHTLLNNSKSDPELHKKINGPGAVLFLHLLAMDTYGHSYLPCVLFQVFNSLKNDRYRPYASEYLDHIYRVDQGIQRIYETMEEMFPDKRTAYLFCYFLFVYFILFNLI